MSEEEICWPSNVLLEGIVGSRAYGLNHSGSDTDRLGIFVRPTSDFWGLKNHPDTFVDKDSIGDYTYHEARKYVGLALKCNPTVLELLWLDDYSVMSDFGLSLIERRKSFLSRGFVKNAYLGYATQQLQRIIQRPGKERGGPKDAKNARHLWRLIEQGVQLYTTGTMKVKVSNPRMCQMFGEAVADGDTRWAENTIEYAKHDFDRFADISPLPEEPNKTNIETWLVNLRSRMLVPERGLNYYDRTGDTTWSASER